MSIDEAVRKWVDRDFSSIPTSLIIKAYKNDYEELELLSNEYPVYAYPCAHGWMFHPENSLDEKWIKENIETVEKCGFLIYESEEAGILLGVDGGGYCFWDEHWKPLYKAVGFKWHEEEKTGVKI